MSMDCRRALPAPGLAPPPGEAPPPRAPRLPAFFILAGAEAAGGEAEGESAIAARAGAGRGPSPHNRGAGPGISPPARGLGRMGRLLSRLAELAAPLNKPLHSSWLHAPC